MKKACSAFGWILLASVVCLAGRTFAAPVPEIFSRTNSLPPTNSVYVSPAQWHALYAAGIIIRDVRHRFFTQNLPVPPLGATQTHTFGSTLDYSISTDGGATFQPANGTANCTVRIRHVLDSGGKSFFDTEMLALDLTSGTTRLRESPTLPSRGKTTSRAVPGGHMISSFFDVFTELSMDGGQTWMPAKQATHVEMRSDPAQVPPVTTPTPRLPPPNGVYVSPQQYHALYAQGIIIKDVKHKIFTEHLPPPPPGGTTTHTFDSQLDMQVSGDGGLTFQQVRSPAHVQVRVSNAGSSSSGLYDTEMLSLSLTASPTGFPTGLMLRESPTLASRGQTQITPQADGTWRIGSFFDIFTELSLDGGQTWSPSTAGAVRVELQEGAPPQPAAGNNLPPLNGEYISPQQWHALYAQGIIISNVIHRGFLVNQPPPPPGQTQVHDFDSQVDLYLVMPPGGPVPITADATVSVRVTGMLDSNGTRFFDTEMLQLDIHGGNLPLGVMVRESPSKASLGRTSIRPASGAFRIDSFFDVFTELSLDGGATWMPSLSEPATMRLRTPPAVPVNIVCPLNMTVPATGPGGAIVNFTATANGGCDTPVVTSSPPSGSLFPVGTTTVTCTAKEPCGNSATCTFTVTVQPQVTPKPEYFFRQPGLPPLDGVYISPAQYHILTALGIQIRDVRHRFFTQNVTPPPLGGTSIHTFDSQLDFELSQDGGATYHPVSVPARVVVRVTHTHDLGGTSFFDTEMLQLDISGGTLPAGFRFRESPTLSSRGQTSQRPVPEGYLICSFFDIFTDFSTDGGLNWNPVADPAHVELRTDPGRVAPTRQPTRILPPPNGTYISPQQWHALYAQGIIIKDVKHKFFTQSIPPPPPGVTASHTFVAQLDMQISTDNGVTFQQVRTSGPVGMRDTAVGSGDLIETEMTSMMLIGGGLPPGVVIRESPTLPSRGLLEITPQADGSFQIDSFFDIFTELSVTGSGGPFTAATSGPVRVELVDEAPEQITPTPLLPPPSGEYTNTRPRPLIFAPFGTTVIVISNVTHRQFTPSQPPPTSGSVTDNFSSIVEMDVSQNGLPPDHVIASASASARVVSMLSKDNNATRYFDTEMLRLDLFGGALMLRESPTLASLGRTSWRSNSPSQHRISSFFDIFTELSVDGGVSWWPATNGPHTVRLRWPEGLPPVSVSCSPNIIVYATSASGAVVTYPAAIAGGGCSPPTVTCSPASGSVFPVGTTVVTCVAQDSCGNIAICTFTVTVKPYIKKRPFPSNVLPPPNGQYVSPQQWHALYAGGIYITNASHRRFLGGQPPPPPGPPVTHQFNSEINFLLSTDNGLTFQPVTGHAEVVVLIGLQQGPPGTQDVYDTEMLSLNLTGGGAVMIRESPTLASTGQTKIQSAPGGGFMIDSFFDVFTELSLDGGVQWLPSEQPAHMELGLDPATMPVSLMNARIENGQPKFTLPTRTGLRYFTRFKTDLGDPDWFILHAVSGNNQDATVDDYMQEGLTQRYYQTLVEEDGDPSAP